MSRRTREKVTGLGAQSLGVDITIVVSLSSEDQLQPMVVPHRLGLYPIPTDPFQVLLLLPGCSLTFRDFNQLFEYKTQILFILAQHKYQITSDPFQNW